MTQECSAIYSSMIARIKKVRTHAQLIAMAILFLFSGMGVGCSAIWSNSTLACPTSASPTDEAEKDGDRLQHAFAYFLTASLYEQNEEYEEAKAYLQKALEYDPGSSFLHNRMAGILKALKDSEGALKYAKRAVEIDPSIENRMLLADLYASLRSRRTPRQTFFARVFRASASQTGKP